jgi:LmbE family N-acetylglucosaminyl deacetylase
MKKILILVPHPDDDVLSFGGLMAKSKIEGDKVHVHCFAIGGPCSNAETIVRHDEFIEVMNYFGCSHSEEFERDGVLSTFPNTTLTGYIDNLIADHQPEEVYCTCKSEHADHISLYNAFMAACRLKSGFMPRLTALGEYPFLLSSYTSQIGGKIYQPLTEEMYNMKQEAFKLYASQWKPSPSPLGEDGVRILAETRGLECGYKYAELYYQTKYIRNIGTS